MSTILVIAEIKDSEPKKATLELLSKANELATGLSASVSVAAIGSGLAGFAAKVAPYGATKVYVADLIDRYSTEGYAAILSTIIAQDGAGLILFTASAMGKDLAPRLAARLDAGFAADCVAISADGGKVAVKRPVYAGKAFTQVAFGDGIAVVSLRPNSFPVAAPGAGEAQTIAVAADMGSPKAQVVEVIAGQSAKPDLTEADRIVSGGRAMKAAENFRILDELADILGAAVGASRAAVDSGFAAQSIQVGQTGKTVNPTLYIACGISGAIQHRAGMRTSKTIVAINKDPEAPIFQIADYGIVADLFEAVPVMTAEIRKLQPR